MDYQIDVDALLSSDLGRSDGGEDRAQFRFIAQRKKIV
jgi:hypothetical protein